jgi:hypothetical protein
MDVLEVERHMASVILSQRRTAAPEQSSDDSKLGTSILQAAADEVRQSIDSPMHE